MLGRSDVCYPSLSHAHRVYGMTIKCWHVLLTVMCSSDLKFVMVSLSIGSLGQPILLAYFLHF